MTAMAMPAKEITGIKHDDTAVKWFLYPSLFFMITSMLFGLFISVNGFVLPDYFSGEYATFGRVRPMHVMGIALLFLLSADVGLMFYFVPRLTGAPIWSQRLAKWTLVLWWSSLIIGNFSYPFGTNFGWEYAEFPNFVSWIPVKVMFTVAWLMVVVNIFMTIANRTIPMLYVSLWYTMGTLIWTTITYIVGSYSVMWLPYGLTRVNASFFYVHNLVGLIFTPMGLATAYYFLPKAAKVPIYSHRLSMIGFWTIAFVYAWTGSHHLIHGPISQWLQTVSIIFSIWLFIPVFTVVTNIFGTIAQNWTKYTDSVPVRFIITGTLFYLVTCVQGPLQALRNVNEITSKTDWIIGHAHIALYGTFAFFAFAGIYHAVSVIERKPIWSQRLAEWHFNLNILGAIFFILPLWIGGFIQGIMWTAWATGTSYAEFHANLTNLPFLETVAAMRPYWILRSLGGAIIVFANLLFVINIYNTVLLEKVEPLHEQRA